MHYAKTTATAIAVALATAAGASIVAPMADTYLQSDGTQAIDTGYYASNKTKVVIDFEGVWDSVTGYYAFGAVGTKNETPTMGVYGKTGAPLTFRAPASQNHVTFNTEVLSEDNTRYLVTIDHVAQTATLEYDGNTFSRSCGASTGTNDVTIAAFAIHADDGTYKYPLTGKIYSMQIYDDGTLVRDFIPYGFGATTGLYDRVNGRVHENVMPSGNPFVIGTRYDDAAYVRGNETEEVYIDTDFTPDQNTKVEIDFALMATTTDARVFGTVTRNGLNMELRLYRTGKFFYNMQDDSLNNGVSTDVAEDLDRHVFTLDGKDNIALLTSENGSVTNYYTADFTTDMANAHTKSAATHLYVLGAGNGTSGTGGLRKCDVKVYGMKIWDNGTLVRNLTPRIVNGETGLWDSENSEFHGKTSDSVGNVRYGGPIESDFVPAFTVNPQSGEIPVEGSVTLSAFAPGALGDDEASGYQWFLGDDMLEGATGSTLVVDWTKDTRLVRTYKCIAFFNVFGYAESTEAVLTNAPAATVIIMK